MQTPFDKQSAHGWSENFCNLSQRNTYICCTAILKRLKGLHTSFGGSDSMASSKILRVRATPNNSLVCKAQTICVDNMTVIQRHVQCVFDVKWTVPTSLQVAKPMRLRKINMPFLPWQCTRRTYQVVLLALQPLSPHCKSLARVWPIRKFPPTSHREGRGSSRIWQAHPPLLAEIALAPSPT